MQPPEPDPHLGRPSTIRYSLILVTYNASAYLGRCLAALSPEVGPGCEVIVVDNASGDPTAGFVAQNYPSFRLIRNQENIGFAAACNQAAQAASGEILVFLNPDTEARPGWLRNLTLRLEQDSSIALVNSKILLASEPGKIAACGLDVHFTGLTFARHFLLDQEQVGMPEPVQAITGASFAVRRDVWEKLGGFDGRFFMYFEDVDLSWRAQLAGYQCLLAPDSQIYHRHPARPSDFSLYYSARNRPFMLIKNYRWVTLALLSPAILLAELVDWLYYASFGFEALQAKCRSYGWLVTHIPTLRAARRESQALRRITDAEILQQRDSALRPVEVTGGVLGRIITRGLNGFFKQYAAMIVTACKSLGV
jgi:hypothetical protein